MNKPIVSINIGCYNRIKMLEECIDSFVDQTFGDWELILVDDGSEENLTSVGNFDSRIRYFRQEHEGIARAYNLALDKSSGKYVIAFGSDDLASKKNFLEEMVAAMEKYTDYDAVYCNNFVLGTHGNIHRQLCRKTLRMPAAYEEMLVRQYLPHQGTMWRIEKMPRYDETLESAVDWELFLTALERGVRFKHIKKKLWTYRVGHPREFGTKRQEDCCDRILRKRGYYFDRKARCGIKICS